ncbi:MAG: MtnX-like HAD-IB family phosphatase [Terriglobia bacterium]
MTPHLRPIIFCDFDGTISLSDVTDEILTRLAPPDWREVEQLWIDGKIGSRECLARQLAMVTASADDLNALIDSIPIDPGFHEFVRFVGATGVPFVVVSDGLDFVIRRVLAHAGLHSRGRNGIHFYSSAGRLVRGRLAVSFPHFAAGCEHGCATCKPGIIRSLKNGRRPVIYVGDGLSDQHAVGEADLVFARRPLLEFCRRREIPARLFETFGDVEEALSHLFAGAAEEISELAVDRGAIATANPFHG